MKKKLNITFYLFLAVLLIPNVVLSFTENLSVSGAITNVLLPGGVYYLLMSLSRKIGRTIWLMFPFVFFAAFQIVLLSLYGRSVIAVDMFLNLVTTNPTEVSELLGNMLPSVGLVAVIYLPFPALATYYCIKGKRLSQNFVMRNRRVAIATVIAGIFTLTGASLDPEGYKIRRDLYPVNVGYNIYLAVERSVRTSKYLTTSSGFEYHAEPTHDKDEREVYILIIGETSRAANWQLHGYSKKTNPRLSLRSDIYAGDSCFSESNTTHKSVPMLLSPIDATNFGREIYNTKSMISGFKEAGFKTLFLSNQRRNHSFIDYFAEESDSTVFIRESEETNPVYKSDLSLLQYIDSALSAGNKKQLIVLHTYGSHFNYNDRYDEEDAIFGPTDYTKASKGARAELINAYDNTIVSTDRLIAECIERIESIPGVTGGILYTSDHGEDIFDDNSGRFLHASPNPTMCQVHVPFIVWLSDGYREHYPENVRILSTNIRKMISSSRSFCLTAFDMAGIKVSGTIIRDSTASLFSESYMPREPLYLSDHNESVKLKDIL